jgi:hypothetical protein
MSLIQSVGFNTRRIERAGIDRMTIELAGGAFRARV